MPDALGSLLTHPLRHRLLFEYSNGVACPSELARRLGEPVNVVSYHTRVLVRHGFVQLVRTERRRGALTHFYRSVVATAIDDAAWDALPGPVRRSLTLGTLTQSIEGARRAARNGGFDDPASHLSRSPLELDDTAAAEVARCLRGALDEIARIAADSRARGGERAPYDVVLLSFGGSPS